MNDVLPTLASVLQDGRLNVNGVDGRHLSVPPQRLTLLQRRNDSSFVAWIVIGCTGFGLFSIGALVIAAIVVKRHLRDMTDFTNNSVSSHQENTQTTSCASFKFIPSFLMFLFREVQKLQTKHRLMVVSIWSKH